MSPRSPVQAVRRLLAPVVRRLRLLWVTVVLRVHAARGGPAWLLRSCWRRDALTVLLLEQAPEDQLDGLLATLPPAGQRSASADLAALLRLEVEDRRLLGVDPTSLAALAERTPPAARRVVAPRLAEPGAADAAWVVLQAEPVIQLPPRDTELLVRELRDMAAIEPLLARTSRMLEEGRQVKRTVRLHREALLAAGKSAFSAYRNEEALAWFLRAHEEVGPTVRTWTWAARTYLRLGRVQESREWGEAALEMRPDWMQALIHLADHHRRLGDQDASREYLARALAQPEVSSFYLGRASDLLLGIREAAMALEAAERLDAAGEDPVGATVRRALALRELGRVDEADRLIAPLAQDHRAEAVLTYAGYLARSGHARAAYELLLAQPAAVLQRGITRHLVHLLRRDGHIDLAGEAVREALAARPDDEELAALAATLEGDLRVFTGEWHTPRRAVSRPEPVPGSILHVVGRTVPYASSGYSVRTQHTVRAQRASGMDAQVVSQQGFPWVDGHDAPALEVVEGVPHHRLRFPEEVHGPIPLDERLERNVDALGGLIEQLRPAVLHAASDFRNALIALEAGDRYDLPVVYEMRGFWEETWLAKRGGQGADSAAYRLRQARERDAALRAAHVVTLAPPMRDALIERGVPAERISLAPNAVDPDAFERRPRADVLAAELGIGEDETVVGYISSFVGYEGIDVLIAAIGRLIAAGENVRGLLVGDGEVRPELERQIAELGLTDRVLLTGRVPHDQVDDYYSIIDVFVVPRTNARVCQLVSPLKPYEAMAAARAVVVSGTPVLRTIVEDGVTGVSFTPEDPDDLAARIADLVHDPAQRSALGEAARSHVLANHTWQRNALRYREVYERLGVMGSSARSA